MIDGNTSWGDGNSKGLIRGAPEEALMLHSVRCDDGEMMMVLPQGAAGRRNKNEACHARFPTALFFVTFRAQNAPPPLYQIAVLLPRPFRPQRLSFNYFPLLRLQKKKKKNLFRFIIMGPPGMGASKQLVRPPQRGIFPLDHAAECREPMQSYLACLEENEEKHHKCRELSRRYLQCRMDHQLMAQENLDNMGYSDEAKVQGAREYDMAKEKAGFIAGKHVSEAKEAGAETVWWWQRK
jgi:cytochrome c oxidase assembly protein subunit 19